MHNLSDILCKHVSKIKSRTILCLLFCKLLNRLWASFMSIQKALTIFLKTAWFPNLPTQAPRAGPLGHFQFVCYYTSSCKESGGPCPVISLGKTLRNGISGSKACLVKMFMCVRDGHSVRPGRANACRALCFLQSTPRWATLSLPPGAGHHCG